MKQLLQSLKNGETEVASVPCPVPQEGRLLIASSRTLLSAGTERMVVDFGRASLLGKARQQPEKVRLALEKAKTDGVLPTIEAVWNKLDQPVAMGYCNVGVVGAIGAGVHGFSVGERVVSNGRHAEAVAVPTNLCAKVPASVSDDEAAFTVVGAIALQGIRLIQPTLGEAVVVFGLGLVGLLTVQLLRAHGCRVLGLDFDSKRLALAEQFGAEVFALAASGDALAEAARFSRQRGVDAVIIAAATDSNEPIHLAARMCRKRGRIVLVGVTGLALSRADFYEKELSFQVSCSYGPGRYDPDYEERGRDYPVGFVRWTAQRNFEAVLDLMASRTIDVRPLITHRFAISQAEEAYNLVASGEPSLGILLEYPGLDVGSAERVIEVASRKATPPRTTANGAVSIAFIGAGNYAANVLIPAFKAAGARLYNVASSAGVSGLHAARKFGFEKTTTDIESIIADPVVEAVVIATRHDTHASLVCKALAAGKQVFVEKPLGLHADELEAIETLHRNLSETAHAPILMVGFNRRFAPQVQRIHGLLRDVRAPKALVVSVNAGRIPPEHWAQDRRIGGGRIIGEACHFVDLTRFLVGAPIERHSVVRMESATADTVTLSLEFADGSIGTIHYFANGSKALSKERLEVFADGRVILLDNFRRMKAFGWPQFKSMNLWRQDKGQTACARSFVEAVRGGLPSPIPLAELIEVGKATLALDRQVARVETQ
jgi:predicted dehydrogenase